MRRHAPSLWTLSVCWAAASLAPLPCFAAEQAGNSAPTGEDLFRAQRGGSPPSQDPHDLAGVWWPDRSYPRQQRPDAQLKPGVKAPAQQLGPSLNNSIVKCMPAVRFDGIGSGMSDLYVQGPSSLTLISEEDHDIRQVHFAGSSKQRQPSLTGYSIGHWEGDTLVIETSALKDPDGTPRPALRVTERLRKVDGGNYLEHRVTFTDATRYEQPYTFVWGAKWRPDIRIAENICEEEYEDYQLGDDGVKYSSTP